MNKFFTVLLMIVAASLTPVKAQKQPQLMPMEELRKELAEALKNREQSIQKAVQTVDSLKTELARAEDPEQSYRLTAAVASRYVDLQLDSAVAYSRRLMASPNPRYQTCGQMLLCRVLPLEGRDIEAVSLYNSIDTVGMNLEALRFYHLTGESIWRSLSLTADTAVFDHNWASHSRALVDLLDERDLLRNRSVALANCNTGHPTVESANLLNIIYSAQATPRLKADATLLLGQLCQREHIRESNEELHYLMQSALGELSEGITTGLGLPTLGVALYVRGEYDLTFDVMNAALANAVYSGDTMISALLAPYAGFMRQVTERKTALYQWLFVGATTLFLAALAFGVILARRCRRLKKSAAATARADSPLDERQRSFTLDYLNLYASINERIEEAMRTFRRKLSAGQIEEVHRLMKSNKLMDDQSRLFNETFDRTTLILMPDFVQQVNSLLQPDKQLVCEPGQLSTELRILALARLGIDETAMISRFLGLSHNTIYTYRNRLRSRALDRDLFMEQIAGIGGGAEKKP